MSVAPFSPVGSTFAANATTSSGVISLSWNQPAAFFNITNTGSVPVYYRLSPNTIASVAIPSAGSSTPGQMINAGDSQTIQIPAVDAGGTNVFVTQANLAVITATSSALVYIQPVLSNVR
jgi:hypothetical protein